jgi:hypothetical protein
MHSVTEATLNGFLEHCVEVCAADATNWLCYRASLPMLYSAYSGACSLREEPRASEEDFLSALRQKYPQVVVTGPRLNAEVRYARYLGHGALQAFWRRI